LNNTPLLQPNTRIGERYAIEKFVGYGWNTVYYRAWQHDVERRVLVKILRTEYVDHAEMRTAFLDDARLLARLEHHNIVPLYDLGEYQSHPYTILRYLERGSLRRIVNEQRHVAISEKLRILKEVSDVLDFAHGLDIVHAGIKPANLLLDMRDRVYVTDFQPNNRVQGVEHPGRPIDHFPYVPLEQLENGALSRQTDVFSLAATAFVLLSGVLPFEGVDGVKHIELRKTTTPSSRANFANAVGAVFDKALHPDPQQRHQSATEFILALDSALQSTAAKPAVSVFISYSRQNVEIARQLAKSLQENNVNIWFDEISIQAGETWEPAIRRGIMACDKFIVILSPDAIDSEYVQAEIDYAKEKKKTIIPLLHRSCDIPLNIRLLQYIDFVQFGYSRGFELLMRAILA
jgi:serine/threonine protein kinase